MQSSFRKRSAVLATLCALAFAWGPAVGLPARAASIPPADLIQPAQLAAILRSDARKPVVLQVGFRTLYDQAHIPGADYAGPAGEEAGLTRLRTRAAELPKDADIVLYCGCCPWDHCPNVADAYFALRALGFAHLRVLYIHENFGDDWVQKGYPVANGP